jgi:hypothetical protein
MELLSYSQRLDEFFCVDEMTNDPDSETGGNFATARMHQLFNFPRVVGVHYITLQASKMCLFSLRFIWKIISSIKHIF